MSFWNRFPFYHVPFVIKRTISNLWADIKGKERPQWLLWDRCVEFKVDKDPFMVMPIDMETMIKEIDEYRLKSITNNDEKD